MARVFVSHASKDKVLVEEFVDLLILGVGVGPEDLFCSSLPGLAIPTGSDFVAFVKSKLQNPEVVLLVISPEFLKGQFCSNEVGASWALPIRNPDGPKKLSTGQHDQQRSEAESHYGG